MSSITPIQIVEHRESRKAAGLVGCISGRPEPEIDLFGYGDVQIWFRDASGRLNGSEGFNRKDPGCFCFDCRGSFDPEGTVDAELVNEGHERATATYASLLGKHEPPVARTMTEHPEAYKMGVPREVFFPPPTRSKTNTAWGEPFAPPSAAIPKEIPRLSLLATRHRDVMNESPKTRIKRDLLEMMADFQAELITVMDSRRMLYDGDRLPDSDGPRRLIDRQEDELWNKIHAAELLIESLI